MQRVWNDDQDGGCVLVYQLHKGITIVVSLFRNQCLTLFGCCSVLLVSDVSMYQYMRTEPMWFEKGVKKVIHIHAAKPSLNKDEGCYSLPTVWDSAVCCRRGLGGNIV